MNSNELIMMQSLPLNIKVAKTKLRIEEFVRFYGGDVYISYSGGKDSTVLLHIARSLYPSIEAVFVDTGLEFPELKDLVNKQDNVTTLHPKKNFKRVIEEHGYPVISKEQSRYIHDIRHSTEKAKLKRLGLGGSTQFKLSNKWTYMLNAPFEISNRCCDIMKKNPVKSYEHKTGKHPILGTLACESGLRRNEYMKNGCNSFNSVRPKSTPLGFWTEQDILHYIQDNNVEIPSIYGNIIEVEGLLTTTGEQRTGCIYCLYGMHYDKENRFERLKRTHPQLHDYCMDKLGIKEVLEFIKRGDK